MVSKCCPIPKTTLRSCVSPIAIAELNVGVETRWAKSRQSVYGRYTVHVLSNGQQGHTYLDFGVCFEFKHSASVIESHLLLFCFRSADYIHSIWSREKQCSQIRLLPQFSSALLFLVTSRFQQTLHIGLPANLRVIDY